MKHDGKVVLLTSLVVCLILTTALAGCGGAKTGAKNQVYTASFGKIKVALTVPAEKDSTTVVIEKVDQYFLSTIPMIMTPNTLASYKVDNGSPRPTLCDDYSFNLTSGDLVAFSVNAKEALGNEIKYLLNNQPDRALLSQGTPVLRKLQNTNGVKQGHSATAYCFFNMLPGLSRAMRITVTSKETHQTRVMTKQ